MAQSPHADAAAARPPSPSGGPRPRCVALVCHSWGQASTFYTWNWAKQYLLRRGPDGRLDDNERLFIVKARRGAAGVVWNRKRRMCWPCTHTPAVGSDTACDPAACGLQVGKDELKDDRWKVGRTMGGVTVHAAPPCEAAAVYQPQIQNTPSMPRLARRWAAHWCRIWTRL